MSKEDVKKGSNTLALIVFLLGIFMGAMDTGVVSPARTVIQSNLGISETVGVWMITIYTLSYAVAMPIVSKLSDIYGRKKVYLFSIGLFGFGSLLCGITNYFESYPLLLSARVIQAIGGGGIMPIATAFIGQSFPKEKRGTALGYVGAVYGIATMLGPTIGSAVLNVSGNNHWGWIFFINVPITIIVLLLGLKISENKAENVKKLDVKGCFAISIVILSLMYALTNIDFYNLASSIKKVEVYPFLIIFLIALPIFLYIEKRAKDPVIHLDYFKNREITLTIIIGFISGCTLMATVFIPQFAENVLGIKMGSGGYLVTLMSLFSGIAAPLGGRLVDKYSSKFVLGIGFITAIVGYFVLGYFATEYMNIWVISLGLALAGFGIGFTMGTPLNYIILTNVEEKDSASALSTLSLVRSIGVTISPNIMVNFIAKAGSEIPSKLQAVVPNINPPKIPGMESMPGNFADMSHHAGGAMSPEMLTKFKDADVTSIFKVVKEFMESMLNKIGNGIHDGVIGGLKQSLQGNPHANEIISKTSTQLNDTLSTWKANYITQLDAHKDVIKSTFQHTMNQGFEQMFILASVISLVGFIIVMLLSGKKKLESKETAKEIAK